LGDSDAGRWVVSFWCVRIARGAGRIVLPLEQGSLSSGVLEGLFHDLRSHLAVVGKKKYLGGLGGEALLDLKMPVPPDHLAQICDNSAAARTDRGGGRSG